MRTGGAIPLMLPSAGCVRGNIDFTNPSGVPC